MPRPIVMTEDMKQKAQEEFSAMLDNLKMADGKLNYTKSYTYKDSRAVVWLTHKAYNKILVLITNFSDEVGWHGTVSRSAEREFVVEDIFVYPQEVTGSTVTTDQKSYTSWLYTLDDETFNKIRMQGHSHVNMGVSPSSVDACHRQQILDQLEGEMFYIFMIWNKQLDINTVIYDMERNIIYDDKDTSVKLFGDEDMNEFLTCAKEKVERVANKKTTNKVKKSKKYGMDADLMGYDNYPQNRTFDTYDWGENRWVF